MTRILLQTVLPLLLPTLAFIGWIALSSKRGKSGQETFSALQEGPWFWLIIAGFVLMAATMGSMILVQGSDPSATYQPSRVEDGRILPGEFIDKPR